MSEIKGILIRGGRVIDPYRQIDSRDEDIWVVDGHVASTPPKDAEVTEVNARGLWVLPRLIDMHVHFREPGQTWKETIETGSRAAAHGGIGAVAAMPNTVPVADSPELVQWVKNRGDSIGLVRIFPVGAVTLGSHGEELADFFRLKRAGARAFSDDGLPVASSRMMRAALTYSRDLGLSIINHAEDRSLTEGASVHEGTSAHRLGIPSAPETAEAIMVWRDVLLAGLTGGRLHLAHVSARESLEALGYARQHQYQVTAEASPHHLLLNDEALLRWQYNSVTKVNPPLRPEASRQALLKAVAEGLVDVLASDHAPHHLDEKSRPYPDAPFGISGLETIVSALITALIEPGLMSPLKAWSLMTTGPDRVLGLQSRGLRDGAPADVTLINPTRAWKVDPDQFYSLGHNTPFAGITMTGQAVATMVGGHWTMRDGEVANAGIS